jgi:ketosteroid isomerase-like protein
MSAMHEEESRLDELFSAIDTKNTEAFLNFLTEDATFRFGSAPEICGHAAIREGVNGFFGTIAGSKHHLDHVMADGSTLVCEGTVQYQCLDGRELTIPFVDIFEYADNLISAYKIYIDISPLYSD